ncbi:MAG: hypothetical protein KGL35_02450 [Bradyrhizobium sp.]|nr:hypothetical protein [Bradyrhizobium sp.]
MTLTKPDITSMALWHNWRAAHSLSSATRVEAKQTLRLIAMISTVKPVKDTAIGMLRVLERENKLIGSAA